MPNLSSVVTQQTLSKGSISHLGISVVFGSVVGAMIYAVGHISGAHFNPAVTLGFWQSGCFPKKKVIPYICSQMLAGVLASLILRLSLGKVAQLGATLPLEGNYWQCFILEIVLTFILMFVILGSGLDRRSPDGFAGLAIVLTVGREAICMGPITGASMNSVRSLAPAIVGNFWEYQWIYVTAPILGAQFAVYIYMYLSNNFKDLS